MRMLMMVVCDGGMRVENWQMDRHVLAEHTMTTSVSWQLAGFNCQQLAVGRARPDAL